MPQKAKVIVLLLTHHLLVLWRVVIVTYKMKESMDYDAVKFLIKFGPELDSVFADAVYTYK